MKSAGGTLFLLSKSRASRINAFPYCSGKYPTDPISLVSLRLSSSRASGAAFWPTTAQQFARPLRRLGEPDQIASSRREGDRALEPVEMSEVVDRTGRRSDLFGSGHR